MSKNATEHLVRLVENGVESLPMKKYDVPSRRLRTIVSVRFEMKAKIMLYSLGSMILISFVPSLFMLWLLM